MRPGRRTRELHVGVLALVFVFVTTTVAHAQVAAQAGAAEPAVASEPASAPVLDPVPAVASDPDPDPDPSPSPSPSPSPDPDPDPASDPASDPAPRASSSSPTREALLQAAITSAERDQPSLPLPWLATGLSVTTLLAGTVVGVITVATCDGSCSTAPVWPWLIIAGCTFTSASTAWLVIAHHDQSEARHRLERARRELERDRIDRAPRAAAARTLTLRASF